MNNPQFVSLKSGVGFCSTAVLFAVLLTGTSLFAVDVELELQRSDDLLEWKSLAIRPEMLTKEGRIRQSREGDIGFFRQQIAESKPTEISEQHRAEILHIIDSALEENEIPGILFGIKYRGEEPIVLARGVNDPNSEEPLQEDARFRIGSASKTFVGMAALRLIQQGRLGFEDSLSLYLPESILSNYDREKITIRMLLRHTSGINNYTDIIEDWFLPYILDRTRIWSDEELVELVNSRYEGSFFEGGKVFDPGQGWFYSNTNTVLLGMVIERVSGKPIRDYIMENFLNPLELSDTIYPDFGESMIPSPVMKGYINWANHTGEPSFSSELEDVTVYDPSGVGAAGAMISTVSDLLFWMEEIAWSDDLIGDYRRGHIDWRYFRSFGGEGGSGPTGSYGMNLAHEPDWQNNADYFIVGHRGQISGYDTAMMYLPNEEAALVLVCNRTLLIGEGLPSDALEVALNSIIGVLFPEMIADHQMIVPDIAKGRKSIQSLDRGGFSGRYGPLQEYR